jgi:hypothetical protein
MQQDGEPGDVITLQALANVLRLKIQVLSSKGSSHIIIPFDGHSLQAEDMPVIKIGYMPPWRYVSLIERADHQFSEEQELPPALSIQQTGKITM